MRPGLFARGRRLAAVQAELDNFKAAVPKVLDAAVNVGKDRFAAEIAAMMTALEKAGRTDTEVLDAVNETVIARLEVGLPPSQWFARHAGGEDR
jgi:hypothetical protein